MLIGIIIISRLFIFPRIQFEPDFLRIQLDPQQEYVPIVCLDRAGRHDGSLLLQAKIVAILQVNRLIDAPASVTTFDQRRAIERPQAGQQGQRQTWTFAETKRPTILDGFEYGGWTFDNGYFVIHKIYL